MKLLESVINKQSYQKENLPEGILARVTYPIMRFDELNANKRKYGRKVAENVLKDKAILEKLKTRTLFGDEEHPDYVQVKLNNSKTANIISDLYIDEAANTFNAVVDILPTIAGKFIYTLYEAGCDVGVSTRAEGDLSEEIDESTHEKVFSVIPESYRLSCLDHTGDPSTAGARPVEFVKAVKANYESKKFDKESTISLLESVNTEESKSLLESIKKDSTLNEDKISEADKSDKHCKSCKCDKGGKVLHKNPEKDDAHCETCSCVKNEAKMKVGDIVVLKEGYKGILNQMFSKTGKAIVQVGVERKMVLLSECTLLEDYGSGDNSGLMAAKKEKPEDKKKEPLLDDKANQGDQTFPCSTCKAVKSMAEVGSHSGEEYTCKECAEKVNESLMQELKNIDGQDVNASASADTEMGASTSPEEKIIPGQDSDESEPDAQDTTQPPVNDELPADAGAQTIDSFEFVEDLYDYALTLNPKLSEYDKDEVLSGLTDEIADHAETVLENDVNKLIDLICTHLEKSPHYYSVTEEALEQAGGVDGEETPEGGEVDPNAENLEGDKGLETSGIPESIDPKGTKVPGEEEETGAKSQGAGEKGITQDSGDKVSPEQNDDNPHKVDQPVKGEISKPGLYVVRHASTSYNNKDKSKDTVRGWTDVPLDEKGQEQARLIGQAFSGLKVNKIYYSDLSRTADTAKAIGEACGVTDMVSEESLRSWNMGDFQGKSSADAIPELEKYAKDKPEEKVPGGESFKEFSERAINKFKEIIAAVESSGQTMVIVTHYRDIKLFQAWAATKTQDYSIDPNTFLSDDVEPGTTFYVNMETPGIYNLDKVWEIQEEQDAKTTMESKSKEQCSICSGTGKLTNKLCPNCRGTGDAVKEAVVNEDENIGDHLHLHAKKLYNKAFKDLTDEEKETVKLKSTAGLFPTKESKINEFKGTVSSQDSIIVQAPLKFVGAQMVNAVGGRDRSLVINGGNVYVSKSSNPNLYYTFKDSINNKIISLGSNADAILKYLNSLHPSMTGVKPGSWIWDGPEKNPIKSQYAKDRLPDSYYDEVGGGEEKLPESKGTMQFRVQEAIHKAEKESLIEQAETIIRSIQENYIKDVIDNTGKQDSAKKLSSENESLKKTLESLKSKSEALSTQILETTDALAKTLKELEEAKSLVESKVGEVANLQQTLVETKETYENSIINEKIKATARVTGLKLDESQVKQLRECKDDASFFKRLESIRENISQRILHQNVLTEIKVVESAPKEEPVLVGGGRVRVPKMVIESIGTALDSMAGRKKK